MLGSPSAAALNRSEGAAVLTGTGDASGLSGADHALALREGQLAEGPTRQLAQVLPLRRAG
jgi:hypothetical protein